MQKWEYKVLQGYQSEGRLNQLGQEGWELVIVATGGAEKTDGLKDGMTGWGAQDVYTYLKRPK